MDEHQLFKKLDKIASEADHSGWCVIIIAIFIFNQLSMQDMLESKLNAVNKKLEIISTKMDTVKVQGVKFTRQ